MATTITLSNDNDSVESIPQNGKVKFTNNTSDTDFTLTSGFFKSKDSGGSWVAISSINIPQSTTSEKLKVTASSGTVGTISGGDPDPDFATITVT